MTKATVDMSQITMSEDIRPRKKLNEAFVDEFTIESFRKHIKALRITLKEKEDEIVKLKNKGKELQADKKRMAKKLDELIEQAVHPPGTGRGLTENSAPKAAFLVS